MSVEREASVGRYIRRSCLLEAIISYTYSTVRVQYHMSTSMDAEVRNEAPEPDAPPPLIDHDLEILRTYLATHSGEFSDKDMMKNGNEVNRSCAPEKLQRVIDGMKQPFSTDGFIDKNEEPDDRNKTRARISVVSVFRTLLLDIPLSILFAAYVGVYCLQEIHDHYFLPFLDAAARMDTDLENEYTYYDRSCTVNDLSTRNLSEVVLTKQTRIEDALDTFMLHGGVVLPQVLTPSTVQQLREHVVKRNANLQEVESIELSQGTNRLSFAFDASEAPIVSQALKEIATNSLLQSLLEKLIGKDPAVAEITAITAYYGCPDQAWHQDVKADGSPLKFGRTYTHSYSFFLPLQDTSAPMGATDFCPGTHYCPNDGMADICEKWGMRLSEATPEGLWKGGDGALLSQHVWHRGAAHTDEEALERILFVVSFLARPDLVNDRRQLSRGTYFHMRWNMWGHSWKDLLDANRFMAKPFSILRCLGLWKLKDRNWGYDLITSAMLRLANEQQGMTDGELKVFVDTFISKLHIPEWLQGPVIPEYDAWQIYLRETLQKCLDFLRMVNSYALVAYMALAFAAGALTRKTSILTKTLIRLLVLHGIILLLGYQVLNHVQKSQVVSDLRRNRLLLAAFPVEWRADNSMPNGPTAIPERDDILVGTRFDAKFLGGYDRWLDYHPGNRMFRAAVADSAMGYVNYSGLPNVFPSQVATNVISLMTRRGRFLYQDYRSGVWRVMSEAEVREHVRKSLLSANSRLLAVLNKELAYMLADYRFGLKRGTALARDSQAYLLEWRNNVFFSHEQKSSVPLGTPSRPPFSVRSHLPEYRCRARRDVIMPKNAENTRWLSILTPTAPSLQVGDVVMSFYPDDNDGDGKWYRSSIVDAKNGKFLIAFDDFDGVDTLPPSRVRPIVPIEEGVVVRTYFEESDEWFEGTVVAAHPSRHVAVRYDDGDLEEWVPSWRYEVVMDS